ncbi:hypothetical protein [Bacillus sp. FJAT-26390]|uniref:hypothetical protein n=1 Tax=Bacillus sp. FJAT-26390 TaxID=1743142 RepID=UPI0008080B07|nr:hypothetical protein [Bacillus sp. FJAT-26390]OBZ17131.1 hypothetical protein A7975_04375 [Bacillus sp. FJAT-26390]
MPMFSLSKPTGTYQVGTVAYHWTDEKRAENFAKEPQAKRELMVQICYPAVEGSGKKQGHYL